MELQCKLRLKEGALKTSRTQIYILALVLLTSTSIQKTCGSSCLECDEDLNSRTITCKKCQTGYKLESGKCVACEVDGCMNCNIDSVECQKCKIGWYNSTTMGYGPRIDLVYKCTPCITGCQICTNDLVCNLCQPGFMSTADNRCKEQNTQTVMYLMIFAVVFILGLIIFIMRQTRYINLRRKEEKRRREEQRRRKEIERQQKIDEREAKKKARLDRYKLPSTERENQKQALDDGNPDGCLVTMDNINIDAFENAGHSDRNIND